MTASPERLDVVIGFNTGDLVWLGELAGYPSVNGIQLRLQT
jgi:hypothetical protein